MGGDIQRRIEAEGYLFEGFRTWVRLTSNGQVMEDSSAGRDGIPSFTSPILSRPLS